MPRAQSHPHRLPSSEELSEFHLETSVAVTVYQNAMPVSKMLVSTTTKTKLERNTPNSLILF